MQSQPNSKVNEETMRLSDAQVARLLRECCENGIPATIAASDMQMVSRARFVKFSADDQTVTLDIFENTAVAYNRMLICCVSFFSAERAWLFLSQVRDYRPVQPEEPPQLRLKIPTHIIGLDLRQSMRMAVGGELGFNVTATTDQGAKLQPQPIDISLGGMQVEFSRSSDPNLSIGTSLKVSLSLNGDTVAFDAEIRHRVGAKYGLYFVDVAKRDYEPPAPFQRIVKAMEKQWRAQIAGAMSSSSSE